MKKLNVFIETAITEKRKSQGKFTNEYYFIEQYLHHVFEDMGVDYSITGVGGKDKLNFYDSAMQQNTANGELNLVIFDCDEPETGGGFEARSGFLERLRTECRMDFDYFLFPNNKDNGAFEHLLLNIINPRHKGLIECFHGYEMCIAGQDPDGTVYQTPNMKAKIYSYITSFKHSRKENERIKGGNWDFQNKEYWDLDAAYLNPLKQFLLSFAGK